MTKPRLSSLGMVKSLDIQHVLCTNLPDIEEAIRWRIIQLHFSWSDQYGFQGDYDSALEKIGRFVTVWSSTYRPHLSHMKASGNQRDVLSSLLQL
jgi:hypothetical protein